MKCLRSENLVYIAIRKNASTFYTNFFQLQLGWEEISLKDIKWGENVVFSHISNPMDRHVKGIAESIAQHDLIRDIFNDPKFCQILGYSIVDPHCVPICSTLGENVKYIDWILLDSPTPSENLTAKFLSKYNVKNELTYEEFKFRNTSIDRDKEVRSKIKNLMELHKDNDTLNLLYEQDKILYNYVKQKFEEFVNISIKKYGSFILDPKDSKDIWRQISWDEISWLRHE
jgi:hypothetical protein